MPDSTDLPAADPIALAQRFADMLSARSRMEPGVAPAEQLQQLGDLGLLVAPLPRAHGGLGLGTEPGGHLALLRVLALVGGADLALGRLYEGHVNALILIAAFGTSAQIKRAANDAQAGLVFGVWKTGNPAVLRLDPSGEQLRLTGHTTFDTGAGLVQRPIINAELTGSGSQMSMPRMERFPVANAGSLDRENGRLSGMESSESDGTNLIDALIDPDELLGAPGDFERDPLFRGGAIRFAAVQAGAILRLYHLFADWLKSKDLTEDPYQIAQLGELALGAQEAALWIERAGTLAESGLFPAADPLSAERVVECANMTCVAMERIATPFIQNINAGVKDQGLLQSQPLERVLRDLTMSLQQSASDRTLAALGRAALRERSFGSTESGLWSEADRGGSLPPSYFDTVYAASADPWNFETSEYEAGKYQDTLAHLPRPRYQNALEIGCSIGVLTELLAARCENLLSVDVSARALATARARCADHANVHFAQMQVPAEMPEGCFDLIVLSEVGYYWQRNDLLKAATLLAARQPPGAHLILVHFTPFVSDYPLTGDQVHTLWLQRPEWRSIDRSRAERYRLDLLERRADTTKDSQVTGRV